MTHNGKLQRKRLIKYDNLVIHSLVIHTTVEINVQQIIGVDDKNSLANVDTVDVKYSVVQNWCQRTFLRLSLKRINQI